MDKLSLLRGQGRPYFINDKVQIKLPTLKEIEEYGEKNYWNLIYNICSTSYDHRFMLDDAGVDYEDVNDFSIFCMIMPTFDVSETNILFGSDIDFQNFQEYRFNGEPVLYDNKCDIVISDIGYELIVEFLRNVHGIKRNYKIAGNKAARHYHMIEERKKLESELSSTKYSSTLEPLISALVNCADFKYDYSSVWNLTIYQLLDAVRRISNTDSVQHTMMGIYTGNIDPKKIPQKQLNWLGELQ